MMHTLNRNFVLRSTQGLSVRFEKGVPIHVPPALIPEAKAVGAIAVDDKEDEAYAAALDAAAAPASGEPTDATTRVEQLEVAFAKLTERNNPNDFTASGMPKTPAIARIIGWEPDAGERASSWAAWRRKAADGE
jgi:hypothetical protein